MKFEIYTTQGLIGYATAVKPFNIPGKCAIMLEGFESIGGQVEETTHKDTQKTIQPVAQSHNPGLLIEDREVVRERLPNLDKKRGRITVIEGGKAVDINIANGKSGGITKGSYFRCPDCGQSAILSVDGQIVIRELDGDKEILKTGQCIDMQDYHYEDVREREDLQVITLAADDSIEGFCPKCLSTSLLARWLEAWENPTSFFEFDHPCAICGGETVEQIAEGGTQIRLCENDKCKYQQLIGGK